MTTSVYVRCAHEGHTVSQLQEISRIRMLRRSFSGWQLMAEIRDNEDNPKTYANVSVTAEINRSIRRSYMQIVWPVATKETFGLYRCDFIGFDKTNFENTVETTPQVMLLEESVTTIDMLKMFLESKQELHEIENEKKHLEDDVQNVDKQLTSLTKQVGTQGKEVTKLKTDMNTAQQAAAVVTDDAANLKVNMLSLKTESSNVDKNTKKINYLEDTMESLRKGFTEDPLDSFVFWPEGKFALLQPKSGCPIDLTFFGGGSKYWQIHTESSPYSNNRNSHSQAFLPGTLFTDNNNNFATLKFCEANGLLNTGLWPSGSYCINKLLDFSCPAGFETGEIQLDVEDTNPVTDFTSESVVGGRSLLFCCMTSGDTSTSITLPTRSPFLLYRRGNQCQRVGGMNATDETIVIDTENTVNRDHKIDNWPDVDIHKSGDSIMTIHLCLYTPI